jgi:LPS export ABC transporter protein LptC/lipopolysaccharide transport protein LptA
MKRYLIVFTLLMSMSAYASAEDPQQKFQGFNLEGFAEDGSKSWDVNGDTADILGEEIKLTNVDANTYGERKMNVKAKTGFVNQASGKMRLKEDVVITSEEGQQLTTDSLDWDRTSNVVTTQDEVKIMDERFSAIGTGMEARPNLKLAQLNKDVTMYVDTQPESEDDSLVTVTCDGPVVIDQAQGKATFEDNVVAIQGDRTLKADVMEIFFNEDMSTISSMICLGNVQIMQGENKTFAEKAVYNAQTKKLTLSGRPKLILQTEGEGAVTSFRN